MKPFDAFCEAMRMRESSGHYECENNLGYLGAYQFGMPRLCDYGITRRRAGVPRFSMKNADFEFIPPYSKAEFLSTPAIQEKAFKWHVMDLRRMLRNKMPILDLFAIPADLSGCIAVCHLLGYGGLRALLIDNQDQADAFGTHASEYLKQFSGFEVP